MGERSLSKQDRVNFIDLYRACGIILMIMGHIRFGRHFDKWIHAFHMPMFFFISGWFFVRKENVGAQILKKVRSLLVPYIVFELFLWMILMPFVQEYRTLQTLRYILGENTYKIPVESGTFSMSPIPGAMWFLTAFFTAEVIYILLDRALQYSWKLNAAVLAMVIGGMLAPTVLPFRLPWALDAALTGIGFFHFAWMIRGTNAEKYFKLSLWKTLAIGIVISLTIMVCPVINMRTGNYGWYLPFWVNALGAIAAGWNLARNLETISGRRRPLKAVCKWFEGIGKNSIVYLCLNQTVVLALMKLLDLIGINGFTAKTITLVLTLGVLNIFGKLICETKLKVIVGK